MKKAIKKIISYICLVALVFSFSGCSKFVELTESGAYKEISVTMSLQKQMIFCDTGVFSQSQNISVSFGYDSSAVNLSSKGAAEKVKRSVVYIEIETAQLKASGSGVIVDIKGGLNDNEYYIMTCHHVISSGGQITVCVPDRDGKNTGDLGYDESYIFTGYIGAGKQVDAGQSVSLVGGDRDGDIAILKLKVGNRRDKYSSFVSIEKATFPASQPVEYSSDTDISYGEEVFAIGNPSGGLPMTYLNGHISYIDRLARFESVGIMTNLIQHDCAITHGSSGGGLFNMKGQLIGITNGGIASQVGLSYAIPYYNSNEYGFMSIAKELIKTNSSVNYGYVEGRWELGVVVSDAESDIEGSTLLIKDIVNNSNADGKLRAGDYITQLEFLNEKYPITSMESFVSAIFVARECLTTISEIKFIVQRAQ